jgi:uridine kinase
VRTGPGEPVAGPWRVRRLDDLASSFAGKRVLAVDGRGGSGKSTLAGRLAARLPGSVVVHTDDVAWNHSRFGWDDLMICGILTPFRAGREVAYQPPAWAPNGRTGEIAVPAETATLIIEGVGASRRDFAGLLDVAIWVQSDYDEARRRGIARDMARDGHDQQTALRLWWEWEEEEVPFLVADRPWDRADIIVAASPVLPYDPDTEVAVNQ